ncbi:hypothetical protein M8J77_017538 [Diaphorina citri]|nr:hypothetical protein M8J77_017538 [Diaphorina citri]
MLTEPILSHESEYPFPVVPTVLKLAGQGTSDLADSRARLVLYEPAHSGSITHLVDTIDRHHIGTESCPEISIQQQNGVSHFPRDVEVLNEIVVFKFNEIIGGNSSSSYEHVVDIDDESLKSCLETFSL